FFGFGSLALRADRGDLLGCASDLDGHHDIYKINIKTGAATFLFTAAPGLEICDGVAWDAQDQKVYMSPDVDSIIHKYILSPSDVMTPDGTFPVPPGCLVPEGNSGIAVSGPNVWEACDGAVTVYQVDKAHGTQITVSASGVQRTEDLD